MDEKRRNIVNLLALLTAIFLIWQFIEMNQKTKEIADQLRIELEVKKNEVFKISQERLKEKDSLVNLIATRTEEKEKLNKDLEGYKRDTKKVKEREIAVPEDMEGLTEYFNTRYESNSAKPVDSRLGLLVSTATKVAYQLEERENLLEITHLQEQQILTQDTLLSLSYQNEKDLNQMLSSAENEIQERISLQDIAESNINNLEKQVDKLKKKNKFIIPAAIIGVLLGITISN